jgi:hypothetical protein
MVVCSEENLMGNNIEDGIEPDKLYRYISDYELKIITEVTKGVTPNCDIYGNLKQQYSISDKYNSQEEWRKGYGSAYQRQADKPKGAENPTSFPKTIDIHIKSNPNKMPLEGLALGIRLFAYIKNDYFYVCDLSNKKGNVIITKGNLKDEIKNTINLFNMDYVSELEECKPYIEIIAEDSETIKKRLEWMKQVATVYEPVKRGVEIYSHCKNHLIHSNRTTVNIDQDASRQKIIFEVEKKE